MSTGPAFRIFRSLAELPRDFGPTVAAIGNFDGVHLGHQRILSAVVSQARELSARAVVITFDPHPEFFLRPSQAPALLTPIDERLRLLAMTGIDAVLVLPFDAALAELPAREFVRQILVERLRLVALHEGGNFRFGRRAEAGVSELARFGWESGFTLHIHPAVSIHGMEVSSSAIRALVAAGDVRRARWLLGRPFNVRSTQVRDRGVGTERLVPTVNLAPYEGLLPANGVYVCRITIDGRPFQAVTNAGDRPTFAGASYSVESHILNFEPIEMTEATPIDLEFILRLRGERKFSSSEALKTQILHDVACAQRFFRLAK
jgi:riboflavin kinase/FMN adenylyltransferase